MNGDDLVDEVAEVLEETARAHHEAYAETDGTDPEWSSWYAPYLQARLGDRLGRTVTRGELIYLLERAAREHARAGAGEAWPVAYARVLLEG